MVNIIGLGYIGLPTALMMASHGIEVVGTDCNEDLVDTLNSGRVSFHEDGIDELFLSAKSAGIRFSTEYQSDDGMIYIISVPTPYDEDCNTIDISYVESAVRSVLKVAKKGSVIVVESTVSPGTIDGHIKPLVENAGFTVGENIYLAHVPERIIPGNMIYELIHNNRTIGADDNNIGERVKQLYSSFCQGKIIVTDIKTAEMTKVVENTFRAVNIAFSNELSRICRSEGMDVYEVIKICNMHPRVNILQPGPGVGGHCIPVDPWFLVGCYPSLTKVIKESLQTNASQPEFVLNRILEIMKEKGLYDFSRVGLYGLTYKEDVDDIRESPTLQLLGIAEKNKITGFKSYDPYVRKNIVNNQYQELNAFLNDIDLLVIMVKHHEIIENSGKLIGKVILDSQNVINISGVYHI